MTAYRKKSIVVDAVQWFKHGDHPAINQILGVGDRVCESCGAPSNAHGLCKTLEGTMAVCVGSWVITGVKGETYELV